VSYFDKEDKAVGYTYFDAHYFYTEQLDKDTLFRYAIQYLPIYSDVLIPKLDKHNLILTKSHSINGIRLILTKE
ncbi:MAG TPA: hypothetical protein PK323_15175, partial [Bacteroidia bacterium]|nr:hypothetical protein [Bacteroidia bacterium]